MHTPSAIVTNIQDTFYGEPLCVEIAVTDNSFIQVEQGRNSLNGTVGNDLAFGKSVTVAGVTLQGQAVSPTKLLVLKS